jgi:hypothetical protein
MMLPRRQPPPTPASGGQGDEAYYTYVEEADDEADDEANKGSAEFGNGIRGIIK